MSRTRNTNDSLAVLLAGGLDELLPQEVEQLEARLNAGGPEAKALTAVRASARDKFAVGLTTPSRAEWGAVWSAIDARSDRHRSEANRRRRSGWRLAPFSAVAACAALALTLVLPSTQPTVADTLSAAPVEILDMDVSADAFSAVDFDESPGGSVIISIYEQPDSEAGA